MAGSSQDETYPFDCPRCPHEAEYRSPIGGGLRVTWHFYRDHWWYSFKVGCPLIDEEPPQFDTNDQ